VVATMSSSPRRRGPGRLRRLAYHRLITVLAVGLVMVTLQSSRLVAGDDRGPRRLIADPLNRVIAWADLNLQLSPRMGAVRAVRLDPELRSGLGRQGARWLARNGTPRERLRYSLALTTRDRGELALLRAAVGTGLCSPDRKVRRAAATAAKRLRLLTKDPATRRRRPC
jgi:hypothetical protein